MRIKNIIAKDILPIKEFIADDLANVVVIAGPNGVGKTRLVNSIIQAFKTPTNFRPVQLIIEATCPEERLAWSKNTLDTAQLQDAEKLRITIQKNGRRSKSKSAILKFESNRSITQIANYSFDWNYSDPFEEAVGWDVTSNDFRSRFSDTIVTLFRKVRSHRESISRKAEELKKGGHQQMSLDWPDPLETFKQAFSQLLAPKVLLDPDPQKQQLQYSYDGQVFSIDSLSSGEREVINIVFDFLLRNPEDCIVFFDEPELHLHPELSYRLLQTLRSVGTNNQFIFCTHSPDIITASLDQSVFFISPAKEPVVNQAIPVIQDNKTNRALEMLGQSIGVISLGKRIVLVEGTESSLDKQTYGTILRNRFPELVLVPSGGRGQITSFDNIMTDILGSSIWGVQFFMLCDRDAFPETAESAKYEQHRSKLRTLPRYHLENYFLDANILASIFDDMETPDSWLRDPVKVGEKIKEIAKTYISYAVALKVSNIVRLKIGNVDINPSGSAQKTDLELKALFDAKLSSEELRVNNGLDRGHIHVLISQYMKEMTSMLESVEDHWLCAMPGRPVFKTFASKAGITAARLKQAYLKKAENNALVFEDIVGIFRDFSTL